MSQAFARLTRLRIAGFKSFAEPVGLDILPGLTGIVGPNGCGKSNVVEALRWAMGETSARSLRGGEMDDLIFAGTTARASRNLAEVSITMEARGACFPSPFEAEAELQVTRRIERGAGSSFRANGREQRARDVQTLFADLASGARSSGMVSQGRVSALVAARPEERRQVLEEAAGITGLHARRHEAELKLRAAEQNLGRSADLRTQLDGGRESLRRQARQAARYCAISGLIRSAEADHLAVLHGQAKARYDAASGEVERAGAALEAAEAEERVCGEALTEAEAALPEPRHDEAAARTTLERRRIEAETLAAEAERVRQEAEEARARLIELEADLEAASRAASDCGASVTRLDDECTQLSTHLAALPAALEAASAIARDARALLDPARSREDDAVQRHARAAEAATRAAEALQAAGDARATAQARVAAIEARLCEADAARIDPARVAGAAEQTARAEAEFAAAREASAAADTRRAASLPRVQAACRELEHQTEARRAAQRSANDAADRLAQAVDHHAACTATLACLQAACPDPLQVSNAADEAAAREADAAVAAAEVDRAEAAHAAACLRASQLRQGADAATAHRQKAEGALHEATARRMEILSRLADAEAAIEAASQAMPDTAAAAQAETRRRQAEQAVADRAEALRRRQDERREAARALADGRAAVSAADARVALLQAEIDGISAALSPAPAGEGAGESVLSTFQVPWGLEAAMGAALGDSAEAPGDDTAGVFWRTLPGIEAEAPPVGCEWLAGLADVPPALRRLLGRTALLHDGADGDALQAGLAPGMLLVGRDGALWRWDGLVVRPGTPNPAAIRMAQRRRLVCARDTLQEAIEAAAGQAASCREMAARYTAGAGAEEAARQALDEADRLLNTALQAAEAARAHRSAAAVRQDVLLAAAQRLRVECNSAEAAVAAAEAGLLACQPPDADEDQAARSAREAGDCARQVETARMARTRARDAEAAARKHAHTLATDSARSDAAIGAAQGSVSRAQDELGAQRRAALDSRDARAALPDLAGLSHALALAEDEHTCAVAEAEAAAQARQAAETSLEEARAHHAACHAAHAQAEWQHAALTQSLLQGVSDLDAAERLVAQRQQDLAALQDPAALAEQASQARQAMEELRAAIAHADARLGALQAEQSHARRALDGLDGERTAWRERLADATSRRSMLEARVAAASSAWQSLQDRPAATALRAERSDAALTSALATHEAASARLAACEQRVRALHLAQRGATRAAGACRDLQVRAEAAAAASAGAVQAVLARMAERLGPDATLPEAAETSEPAEERARRRVERLGREREEMGPVNLRAELELGEIDQRLATLDQERAELTTAIARLRGAIGHLNREGRDRLTAMFTQVDQHFRTLFTRMMGGGRAHLALIGSDDPLTAGLEIYAEPPGKKLASLSLLSGGEQALTALSLIFAVFRCTPAPVCVLDEVDAPLDDANVERFCTLLDEMVRDTGTSFLVVTHHQVTMSRMDRLFGVTMQERGVSRLLSVDLQRAAAMVEPVLQAAE